MCGFVLYDTQIIMEKRRMGSTDCIKHSLDLFFDLASIFRRLLIILSQKVSEIFRISHEMTILIDFFVFVLSLLHAGGTRTTQKEELNTY